MKAMQVMKTAARRRPAGGYRFEREEGVVAAFAAGAAAGGLLVGDLRFWALLAPLAAVVACGLSERAGRRRQPQTQPVPPVPAALRTG